MRYCSNGWSKPRLSEMDNIGVLAGNLSQIRGSYKQGQRVHILDHGETAWYIPVGLTSQEDL